MAHIGYVRVSSTDQNPSRQLAGLVLDKRFEDRASGKNIHDRPALTACLDYLREGDVLHVHTMDRLARDARDLLNLVESLTGRGITVRFEKQALEFSASAENPTSKWMLGMLAAFSEFERALIRERQREGIAQAKARGAYKGRKPIALNVLQDIRKLVDSGMSVSDACKKIGVSRAAYYANRNKLD